MLLRLLIPGEYISHRVMPYDQASVLKLYVGDFDFIDSGDIHLNGCAAFQRGTPSPTTNNNNL